MLFKLTIFYTFILLSIDVGLYAVSFFLICPCWGNIVAKMFFKLTIFYTIILLSIDVGLYALSFFLLCPCWGNIAIVNNKTGLRYARLFSCWRLSIYFIFRCSGFRLYALYFFILAIFFFSVMSLQG